MRRGLAALVAAYWILHCGQASDDNLERHLIADDECRPGDETCAFNALQMRKLRKANASEEDRENEVANGVRHWGRRCDKACGGAGWCEDYCGPGNACCSRWNRQVRECELAGWFSVAIPGYYVCVTTTAKKPEDPSGGGEGAGDGDSAGPAPAPAEGEHCLDLNSRCSTWAAVGECDQNPRYMKAHCCHSCQAGKTEPTTEPATTAAPCTDSHQACPHWAKAGECTKNPMYMTTQCCASCKGPETETTTITITTSSVATTPEKPCENKNPSCEGWAQAGECNQNPHYMHDYCAKACSKCSNGREQQEDTTTVEAVTSGTTSELVTSGTTSARPMISTMTPTWATSDCHTAEKDNADDKACCDAVQWIYTDGIYQHADWYEGITPLSPFESLQFSLHQQRPSLCPMPCAPPENPPCKTVTSGDCAEKVAFAMNDGIYGHPEWFPELKSTSSFEEFQLHLHNAHPDECPRPCGV